MSSQVIGQAGSIRPYSYAMQEMLSVRFVLLGGFLNVGGFRWRGAPPPPGRRVQGVVVQEHP